MDFDTIRLIIYNTILEFEILNNLYTLFSDTESVVNMCMSKRERTVKG